MPLKSIAFNLVHSSQRKKRVNKDGTGPVWVCGYQAGRHKYFPTGVRVRADQWDRRRSEVVAHPNANAYNLLISRKMADLRSYQVDLINEHYGEHVSLKEFDERYRATGGQQLSFCSFYELMVKQRREISEATRQTQLNTLNHFRACVGEISFLQLKYDTLHDFHQYLLGEEKELTTIDKYHRHLKTYINLAISKGYIRSGKSPYDDFKYDKGRHRPKDFLRLEELEMLEQMDTGDLTPEQIKARDIFLLMAFTGLRFSDAVSMCPRNLAKTRKGYQYSAIMVKNRRRSKKEINLPIYAFFHFCEEEESRAQRWLKHCIAEYPAKPREPFFRGVTNTKVNEYLKIVAEKAGLDKHLTCHVGRHSFGTNMAVKIPVTLLQKYMSHSKIETTMQYIHMARKIEDTVMERIRWEK